MFWSAHSGIIAASSRDLRRATSAFFVPLGDWGIRAVGGGGDPGCSRSSTTWACGRAAGCRPWSRSRKVAAIALLLAMVVRLGRPRRSRQRPRPRPPVSFREFVLGVSAGAVRLRRLAHGDLHGGRNRATRARPSRKALLIGSLTVDRLLRSAERRVSISAAARPRDLLHAGGGRRRAGDGRTARGGRHLGAGDPLGHRACSTA